MQGEFLKDSVTLEDVEIDDSDEYLISIDDALDGKPVFQLRRDIARHDME